MPIHLYPITEVKTFCSREKNFKKIDFSGWVLILRILALLRGFRKLLKVPSAFLHSCSQLFVTALIRLAVVTHNGIYHLEGGRISAEEFKTMVNLLLRVEKTAINTIKIKPQTLVVFKTRGDVVGEIAYANLAKTAGV